MARRRRHRKVRRGGSASHPGFAKVAAKIARKEHLPMARAKAILAASTRRDSGMAHKMNPRLNRVRGGCFS